MIQLKLKKEKKNYLIPTLIKVIIIVILVGGMSYFFVIKPAYNNFIQTKQSDAFSLGQISVLNEIFTQIQQTGYVTIPIGNQTLYLAPFNPGVKQ
jgi:flagellar basal body-associated protein FliL